MPHASESRPSYRAFGPIALAVLILAAGLALRLVNLDATPFWVDEAESSINALTILEHGYPTDSYLGLPIYENTLVETWPDNPEYEFRDISYSRKHMAVYHAWLPLYSIAASFALHHVGAGRLETPLRLKHDLAERKQRTRAARLPAVWFGALFLVFVFLAGGAFYGRDAAWAALLVSAIYPWHIFLSRQARYYSAEVTFTTACCLAVWLIVTAGKWKHFLLGAVAFVLLFHTHLLSFFTAGLMLALFTPLILLRHPAALRKLAVFGAIVAAGSLPWIFLTGFYTHQQHIPRAWTLLHLPADLLHFPPARLPHLIIGAVFTLVVGWVVLARPSLSSRLKTPLVDSFFPVVFLLLWIALNYVSLLTLMPAASFYAVRTNIIYLGPAVTLAAILCATVARILAPRSAVFVAPALFLLWLFASGARSGFLAAPADAAWLKNDQVYRQIASLLRDDTRLYAAPNDHLVITFDTGLPVQSIMPVRKSFLDGYPGDVVFIDSSLNTYFDPPGALPLFGEESILRAARAANLPLDPRQAGRWSSLLLTRGYREAIQHMVGDTSPLEELPAFAPPMLAADDARAHAYFAQSTNELMTRGFAVDSWQDWRAVVFYRFVDPDSRRGAHANYAARLRGATAFLLVRPDRAIFLSPGNARPTRAAVDFQILP